MSAPDSITEARRRPRATIDPVRLLVVLAVLTILAWVILTRENVIDLGRSLGFSVYDNITGEVVGPRGWVQTAFLLKLSTAVVLAGAFMYYYLAGRFSANWLVDAIRRTASTDPHSPSKQEASESDDEDFDDGDFDDELDDAELPPVDAVATLASERDLYRAVYYIEQLRTRLQRAIASQTRNSSLNLILGILTAAVGVFLLFTLAVEAGQPAFGVVDGTFNAAKFWGSLASRYSLALTIQVFAVFFLLTYRRNLIEIKYFNNELTNIEATVIALKLATSTDDIAARVDALVRLARTERNPILTRDQRTVDLSARRQDDLSVQSLVDSAIKAFNAAARRENQQTPAQE